MTDDAATRTDIESIPGTSNILLIAPHGVMAAPYDDIGTAELTREIQKHLGCDAIINTKYRKPTGSELQKRNSGKPSTAAGVLDLNKISQAKRHSTFIQDIKDAVEKEGTTYVFWIHGIDDDNIKEQAKLLDGFKKRPEQLHALIGYGQGPDRSVSPDKRTEDESKP